MNEWTNELARIPGSCRTNPKITKHKRGNFNHHCPQSYRNIHRLEASDSCRLATTVPNWIPFWWKTPETLSQTPISTICNSDHIKLYSSTISRNPDIISPFQQECQWRHPTMTTMT
jgi:hypothetical protein